MLFFFFFASKWALPQAACMLTAKPTWKVGAAESQHDSALLPKQRASLLHLSTVCTQDLPQQWQPGPQRHVLALCSLCHTAMWGQSRALAKHILCIFQRILVSFLERKPHVSAMSLLSRKTQPESQPSGGRRSSGFTVSKGCSCSSGSVGITGSYCRSNFPVHLDIALEFCRANDLRGYMVQQVNAKKQKQSLPLQVLNREKWPRTCSQYAKYNLLYLGHS